MILPAGGDPQQYAMWQNHYIPAGGKQTFSFYRGETVPTATMTSGADSNPTGGGSMVWFVKKIGGANNYSFNLQAQFTVETTHTHSPTYNIYEDTVPKNVGIKIDGVNRTEELGGPWSGSGEAFGLPSLNLAPYIQTSGWHTIEFTSTTLGRITAALTCQQFIRYSGSV